MLLQSLFPVFEEENNNTCHFHMLHSLECFWDSGLQTLTNKILFSCNFFFFKQVEKTICCTRVNDFSLEDEVIWTLSTCCSQEKAYWRVYRPPPGYNTLVENSPVPTRYQGKHKPTQIHFAHKNKSKILKVYNTPVPTRYQGTHKPTQIHYAHINKSKILKVQNTCW